MTENIDLDKPIPPEWRVRGADSDLHSIGLSLFKPQLHPNRRLLYHPLLIYFISLFKLVTSLLSFYRQIKYITLFENDYMYLGELDNYLSNALSSNVIIINLSIIT